MAQKFRLIVLGAGFSRPAGFPLATELWQEIMQYTKHLEGRASKFHNDLNAYIDYRRDCDGLDLTWEEVDFEDFMRFLDVEHFLGLRGSDTWSDEGNEGTIVAKTLIGAILADRLDRLNEIPKLYLEFAHRLQANDIVITFNYDTLLERALDTVAKPYRLFPMRYTSVNRFSAAVGDDRDEVIVLKMHGSIDWFDRKGFKIAELDHKRLGAPPPHDIIFSHADELCIQPVVDGPRFDSDPLRTVYRVGKLTELYNRGIMFLATPRILPPSSAKIVYARQIGDFWDGMNSAGTLNFGMAIIGFSLPAQDEYARQSIYSLVTNYQAVEWGTTVFGNMKSPLAIVDYFANEDDEKAFQRRYRFVDWERAILHGRGFDLTALDSIFQ